MAKKKKTKNKRSFNKRALAKELMKIFRLNPKKPFNYKQLCKELSVKDEGVRSLVLVVLTELKQQERLVEVQRGKYCYKKVITTAEGVVEVTTKGNAYVVVEGMDQDVFVRDKFVKNAVTGDRVSLSLHSTFKKRKPEGEIIAILEHCKNQFVGVIERSDKFAFLLISDPKIHFDIFLLNTKTPQGFPRVRVKG